jgi:anti-anti-sigma regulatory factor
MVVEPMKALLSRMPGVPWSVRVIPETGRLEWVHVDPARAAKLYDVSEDALLRDPMAMMERVAPDDRTRFEQLVADAAALDASFSWSGRVVPRAGDPRWIEVQVVGEVDWEGARRWYALALDVTLRRRAELELESELEARNLALARSEEAKGVLLERLRVAVEDTSSPILEVWEGVLAMPIVGLVDSRRTADMVGRLLSEIARTQASFVIVDLTGVEGVDTKTADHLMKLMRKVEVIGARCVLTGIQPAMAETLVDLGVDFGRLTTLRNLKHGLRAALQEARREREELRAEDDLDAGSEDEEPAAPQRRGRSSG